MTGTKASLKIVSTHRDNTPSGKAGCVTPADSPTPPKPKLLDQLREALCARHYSRRTEFIHLLESDILTGWGYVHLDKIRKK